MYNIYIESNMLYHTTERVNLHILENLFPGSGFEAVSLPHGRIEASIALNRLESKDAVAFLLW